MLDGKLDIKSYRNSSFQDDFRRVEFLENKVMNKSLLDFGCGGGGLLHLLKEKTYDIAGLELDRQINQYINDEGIKCYRSLDEVEKKYDFITLFHVLEHLPNPIATLKELKTYIKQNGKIIIEVPNSEDALLTLYNSKAFADFTYWSCHLFLFNNSTLEEVCKRSGYKINYIKQVQRYPLSNHLYWLANKLPGGHKEWDFLNGVVNNSQYEKHLASIGKCDTLIAEISL